MRSDICGFFSRNFIKVELKGGNYYTTNVLESSIKTTHFILT